MQRRWLVYVRRDSILAEMGYRDYAEYLRSALWATIRQAVLDRDGHRCRCCGERGWEVHHRRYTRAALEGSDLSALLTVCRECHERAEFTGSGRKRSLRWANRILNGKAVSPRIRTGRPRRAIL